MRDGEVGRWGLAKPGPEDGLEVIVKLVGESCNLNCHYCYERRKPYDQAKVLDAASLGRFLRLCGGRPLSIGLHGGEPLLVGRDRMRSLFEVFRAYPGRLRLNLQTNATLLDDTWLDFLDREWQELHLGISLDGTQEMNEHRVDSRNQSTFAQVVGCLNRLERRGKLVGVISVVTRLALGGASQLLDLLGEFKTVAAVNLAPCLDYNVSSKNYRNLSGKAIRVLNPRAEGVPGWATTPDEYATFVTAAFDHWRARGLFHQFTVEPITSVLRKLMGKGAESCHFQESKCAFVLTLYPDGRIGSCDELGMPEAALGELRELESVEPLLDLRHKPDWDQALGGLMKKCSTCSYQTTCGGGCLATRKRYLGTEFDEAYCAYRAKLIDHVRSALHDSRLLAERAS